jgi:hypothetical protein
VHLVTTTLSSPRMDLYKHLGRHKQIGPLEQGGLVRSVVLIRRGPPDRKLFIARALQVCTELAGLTRWLGERFQSNNYEIM